MARVKVRQPPAWSPEGQQVSKEVRELGRELEGLREDLPQQRVPVGMVVLFSASQDPGDRWRRCDGSEISRFDFPDVYTALGESQGPGDGSRTINLPTLVAPALMTYWIFVGGD
ncbi:MAG: tail fiber protein [Myxococcales bacterium]|nr:tail fiber protein [Myxococcales bacterium]